LLDSSSKGAVNIGVGISRFWSINSSDVLDVKVSPAKVYLKPERATISPALISW
jgi:hypothetical protein